MFGVHLNKEKSLTEKKSLIFSTNSKTLSWSKHHGWTSVQSITDDSKGPKSECREVSEVRTKTLCLSISFKQN